MGYDLHITRKQFWADEEGPEITLDEWLAVIDADPELSLADSQVWEKGDTLSWRQNLVVK